MHAGVWEQRQAGCSCWAGGWEMLDGTLMDPYCEAHEWHERCRSATQELREAERDQ